MGKKSRGKRERKLAQMSSDPSFLLRKMLGLREQNAGRMSLAKPFCERLEATRALFRQYQRLDTAIALGVSELWPANTGSPIKHIFAWRVLLDLPNNAQEGIPIASYADFKTFVEALYATWPEFPMLEDFSPEADWGQTKTRLGHDFVPMFYGSCIERTTDFVDAFRITYAHVPEALADMDLAAALQARIIDSMPGLRTAETTEAQRAHVEVAPEDFWLTCRSMLQQIGNDIAGWRNKAGRALDTYFGAFKAPLTWEVFGNTVMQGATLPFLAVESDGTWVPMSVRSAPRLLIDHWAAKNLTGVSSQTHRKVAQFVAERFSRTVMGPLTLFVGDTACENLPISCIISADSGVYLICTCDHASSKRLTNAAKNTYTKVRHGPPISFRLGNGRGLVLSNDGNAPSADERKRPANPC